MFVPREVVVASNAPGTRRDGRWTGTAGANGFPAHSNTKDGFVTQKTTEQSYLIGDS